MYDCYTSYAPRDDKGQMDHSKCLCEKYMTNLSRCRYKLFNNEFQNSGSGIYFFFCCSFLRKTCRMYCLGLQQSIFEFFDGMKSPSTLDIRSDEHWPCARSFEIFKFLYDDMYQKRGGNCNLSRFSLSPYVRFVNRKIFNKHSTSRDNKYFWRKLPIELAEIDSIHSSK